MASVQHVRGEKHKFQASLDLCFEPLRPFFSQLSEFCLCESSPLSAALFHFARFIHLFQHSRINIRLFLIYLLRCVQVHETFSGSCLSQCLFHTHKSFLKIFIWIIFIVTMFNKSVKCFQSKMSVKRKKNPPQLLHVWKQGFFFYVVMKTKLF